MSRFYPDLRNIFFDKSLKKFICCILSEIPKRLHENMQIDVILCKKLNHLFLKKYIYIFLPKIIVNDLRK